MAQVLRKHRINLCLATTSHIWTNAKHDFGGPFAHRHCLPIIIPFVAALLLSWPEYTYSHHICCMRNNLWIGHLQLYASLRSRTYRLSPCR